MPSVRVYSDMVIHTVPSSPHSPQVLGVILIMDAVGPDSENEYPSAAPAVRRKVRMLTWPCPRESEASNRKVR